MGRAQLNVCLVAAPTVSEYEDVAIHRSEDLEELAYHVPLGILSLASVAGEKGMFPCIVDLNRLFFEYSWEEHTYRYRDFCSYAHQQLAGREFDVIGFSTMCSSYPLTIRMAQEMRRTCPSTTIIFGGPQASVVAESTLDAFPFVDLVVRGEAEETFPMVLEALSGNGELSRVPGISFRDRGRVVRNPNAPVIEDLDALPLPAFHLLKRDKSSWTHVALELGRGCPFDCSFCSTNDFFRRRFRLKSPECLVKQMSWMQRNFGTKAFDLVHDMFTVDRKRVVAFCESLLQSGSEFKWACSARTDCVDEALLELMAKAGCSGIFFGIETGSARMQKIIKKNLNLAEAAGMAEIADRLNMATTLSVIMGYPEEEEEDLAASVGFLMDALRYDRVQPQLNLLAPLAATPILTQYRDQLFFDGIYSDVTHQGWRQDPGDRALIADHPDIFPNFYGLPSQAGRDYLIELHRFFSSGVKRMKWLLVAVHQEMGSLLTVFNAWRQWRPLPDNLAKYYCSYQFSLDFQRFLKEVYLKNLYPESVALPGLLEFQEVFEAGIENETWDRSTLKLNTQEIGLDNIPRLANGVQVLRVRADITEIIEALRCKRRPEPESPKNQVIAARAVPNDQTHIFSLPPLLAEVLDLCNGQRTLREIIQIFSTVKETVEGVPADVACQLAIESLQGAGLIESLPLQQCALGTAAEPLGEPLRAGA